MENYRLTIAESRLAPLVACGLSNKEIGKELNKSPNTVKEQVNNLCSKFGAANRTALAVILVISKSVAITSEQINKAASKASQYGAVAVFAIAVLSSISGPGNHDFIRPVRTGNHFTRIIRDRTTS